METLALVATMVFLADLALLYVFSLSFVFININTIPK